MKKERRLKKDIEFQNVYRNGKSFANKQLVLYFFKRDQSGFRLGISVSKKIGNAVVRNKIKRNVRQAFTELEPEILNGYDFVIIARKESSELNYFNFKKSILHLLKKKSLLKNKN